MTAAFVRRHRWAMPVLTALASLVGAGLAIGCILLSGGCGGAAQRTVSALAVAAVAADRANATAYEVIADDTADGLIGTANPWGSWCEAMRGPWERSARVECGIEALADLAIAGQAVIDSGGEPGSDWMTAACGTLAAIDDAWQAGGGALPTALRSARVLVCGFAGQGEMAERTCTIGPVPGCTEVP